MSSENATTTTQDWEGPKTLDEANCYHQGFIGGLTAYAREKGDSTLKSKNELLRRMMDDQGWKTVETLERLMLMTPEEDDAAYDAAPAIPISDEEVKRLVEIATK